MPTSLKECSEQPRRRNRKKERKKEKRERPRWFFKSSFNPTKETALKGEELLLFYRLIKPRGKTKRNEQKNGHIKSKKKRKEKNKKRNEKLTIKRKPGNKRKE